MYAKLLDEIFDEKHRYIHSEIDQEPVPEIER